MNFAFGLAEPTRLYLVQVDGVGPGAASRIQALQKHRLPHVTVYSFYTRPWIYDYSARTGRLLKTMTGPRATDWALLWTSPDGQSLIRSAGRDGLSNGFIKAAIFTGGNWRPFRLPPQTRAAAW
jgi:hypothetical protein